MLGKRAGTGPKVRGPVRELEDNQQQETSNRTNLEPGANSHRVGKLGHEAGCYVPVKVLGLGLQALYDTGAVGSVISTKVWKSIPAERRPALEPCRRRLITVSNHPVDTEGEVTLRMELDGRLVSHLMVVADVIDDLVLGLDLLAPLKLTWDWELGAVRWPERTEEVSRKNFGAGEVTPPEGNVVARKEDNAQVEEITEPNP